MHEMEEDVKLRREIEFLSALIQQHKDTEPAVHREAATDADFSKQHGKESLPSKHHAFQPTSNSTSVYYKQGTHTTAKVDYQSANISGCGWRKNNNSNNTKNWHRNAIEPQSGKHLQSPDKYKWVAATNQEQVPNKPVKSTSLPSHDNINSSVSAEEQAAQPGKRNPLLSSRQVFVGKNGVKATNTKSGSGTFVAVMPSTNSPPIHISSGSNRRVVKKSVTDSGSIQRLIPTAFSNEADDARYSGTVGKRKVLKANAKGANRGVILNQTSTNGISSDPADIEANKSKYISNQKTYENNHNNGMQNISSVSAANQYRIDHRQGSPQHRTSSPSCSPKKPIPSMKLDFQTESQGGVLTMPPSTPNLSKAIHRQADHPGSRGSSPHRTVINKYKYVKAKTLPTPITRGLQTHHSGYHKNHFKLVRYPSSANLITSVQRKRTLSATSTPVAVLTRYKLVKGTGGASTPTLQSGHKLLKKAVQIAHKRRRSSQEFSDKLALHNQQKYRLYRIHSNMATTKLGRAKLKNGWTKRYSLKRNQLPSTGSNIDVNHLLGRSVSDKSKNKYKFIKGDAAKSRHSRFVYRAAEGTKSRKTLPLRGSMKIDRRCIRTRSQEQKLAVSRRLTRYSLVKHSAGFSAAGRRMGQGRFKLVNRIVSRGSSRTQLAASLAVKRSLQAASTARWRSRKQGKQGSHQLCLFYCRFGKCNRGDKCPYKHDPDKVAVCTRFLRGTCKVSDCPFSHKVSEDKMPVCSFFLKGICSKDSCPYRHINVGPDAQLCMDFARGYCSLGNKCTKKHVLVCPDKDGKCPRGKRCPLRHRAAQPHRVKRKRSRSGSLSKSRTTQTETRSVKHARITRNSEVDDDNKHLPMKERNLPSFIALDRSDSGLSNDTSSTTTNDQNNVKPIRPAEKSTEGIIPKFLRKS